MTFTADMASFCSNGIVSGYYCIELAVMRLNLTFVASNLTVVAEMVPFSSVV